MNEGLMSFLRLKMIIYGVITFTTFDAIDNGIISVKRCKFLLVFVVVNILRDALFISLAILCLFFFLFSACLIPV